MKCVFQICFVWSLGGLLLFGVVHAQAIPGYSDYLDWYGWARLKPSVHAGLASSYDRSGGNTDNNHYESPEGLIEEDVDPTIAVTLTGPGIVHRFWMPHRTTKIDYDVRFYVDGEITPRIATTSSQWLSGNYNYFTAPLVNTFAGGCVSYDPICFNESLRIETENIAGSAHYYQYTYSLYPSGTVLPSYTGVLTPEQQAARSDVVSLFNNAGTHPDGVDPSAETVTLGTTNIVADTGLCICDVSGPGWIRRINVLMNGASDEELEGVSIRVWYDDAPEAAVDVPVAYFFGAGRSRALYKSIPMGTDSAEGFYSYWPMPFRERVCVELYNNTDSSIPITSTCVEYKTGAVDDDMCYLHAYFNSTVKQSGQIYHPIFSTTGCGHYVGNLLYVDQDVKYLAMLEGDEVITINGSHIINGTGLEDAYNGGYYYNWVAIQSDEPEGQCPQSAIRPLNGILYVEQNNDSNYARADQYRWQIADCIPFSGSIDVKIENRYSLTSARWTSVAFWYQWPGVDTDINRDCRVDIGDVARMASYWLDTYCDEPGWCDGADLDFNHTVELEDLEQIISDWLFPFCSD